MDTVTTTDIARDALDREIHLVEGAIRAVSGGVGPTLVVGGLRFGEALMQILAEEAYRARVTMTPLYPLDNSGCDIRVTRARG